jgi:hypothetical protein
LNSDEFEAATITGGSVGLQTSYAISADLYLGNITDSDGGVQRGVGLGFYTSTGAGAAANFYGLALHPGGSLDLVINGATPGGGAQDIAYPGAFSATSFHTLSYVINTSTGAISNVTLDGNLESFTSTAFTAVTSSSLAGFYVSSSSGPTVGNIDNFSLADVPEPCSLGLLWLAPLGLLIRRRRC